MKKHVIAGSVLFASLAVGTAMTAQARNKVDTNNDGTLSSAEITTAYANNKPKREQMFKDLDTDHNGTLSATEVGGAANLKKMDANGDGVVSENEFMYEAAKTTTQRLNAVDSNNDGQISATEEQSAYQKAKAKRQK